MLKIGSTVWFHDDEKNEAVQAVISDISIDTSVYPLKTILSIKTIDGEKSYTFPVNEFGCRMDTKKASHPAFFHTLKDVLPF